MKLAILGAPGSGKTWLAHELTQHLPDLQVADAPGLSVIRNTGFDRVLLMGLDLPQAATALQLQADADLRDALDGAAVPYTVVYGQGEQRLRCALRQIIPEEGPPPRWRGVCEKCADPECERRTLLPGIWGSR